MSAETCTSLVGYTADGDGVYVELTLEPVERPGDFQTVTHEAVPADALRLSVSGVIATRSGRIVCAGQCIEEVEASTASAADVYWSQRDLHRLCVLWRRWHLNDMRGGCAHQGKPTMHSPHGYPQVDLGSVEPCPITGYRYGSAWLVEPLPDDVVACFRRLMALPTGRVPEFA